MDRWRACVVIGCLLVAGSGCAQETSGGGGSTDEAVVTVPDVTSGDGAEATSALEAENLTATLDPPPSGDGTGCEVTDQDPAAGEEVEEGTEVTVSVDCAQAEWEDQEGDAWDEFTSGFSDGFSEGCEALFGLSPDGRLFNEDREYIAVDCTTLEEDPATDGNVTIPDEVPEDPSSEGSDLGFEAGCRALFDEEGLPALYHGEQGYTANDCLAQNSPAPTRPARPRRRPGLTAAVYRVSQEGWHNYDFPKRLAAARLFTANNPTDCGSDVTPEEMVDFVNAGGVGNNEGVPVNELMLMLCRGQTD